MKVGDIRKLLKDGRSETIVKSLIKRVKSPYKEFTLDEIDMLAEMGLNDNIISTMIDVTTKLLENADKRKQQEFLLSEQKRIANQKVKERVVYKTKRTQKVEQKNNPVMEKVQNEVVKQGVGMLLDHFF